jgi:4-amino-4-deoxy-L-arabinose transferase-like glycosyltransferase
MRWLSRAPAWQWPLFVIVCISLWRLALAASLPVTQDEAYYFDWARTLAWGYFDHPPGVALLGLGTTIAPGSVLAARFAGWLAATLTLLVLWRLFDQCGLHDPKDRPGSLTLALVLTAASVSGFASGVVITPDTALALCWVLALHEGLAALSGRRWRWITTGLAVGLGLLSKYSLLVIGPVFLLAILLADARALRTRWPYLGALVALLVFSPNLWWNAQQDWLSLRFQFGHGFSTDTGALHLAADRLLADLGAAPPDPATLPPEAPLSFSERLTNLIAFAGTQLALLGVMLLPLGAALLGVRERDERIVLERPARALLITAAGLPLLLFGVVASFSEVEPNWPAMALPALAALLVLGLRPRAGWLIGAALVNLLLLSLYTWHAATAILPLGAGQNRILRETHGFATLAERVAELPGPVLADRYQLAAMLNFYQQRHRVSQWPGLTRPSEYSRGRIAPVPEARELRESGFWLVSARARVAELPGFQVRESRLWRDCPGAPLRQHPEAACAKPLHLWRITRYQAARDGENPKKIRD